MWGRVLFAGGLLSACAFDPRARSSGAAGGPDPDQPDAGAGPAADSAPVLPADAAAVPALPDAAALDLVETLSVPASGQAVQSAAVLGDGEAFLLVARGTFVFGESGGLRADAEYFWHVRTTGFTFDVDKDTDVDVGLAVDDEVVDQDRAPRWGDFRIGHVYEAAFEGQGATISAQIHDGNAGDNQGSLTLEIYRASHAGQ